MGYFVVQHPFTSFGWCICQIMKYVRHRNQWSVSIQPLKMCSKLELVQGIDL